MSKYFLLLAISAIAQDARQVVEESQKRHRSNSQRYEGVLQVFNPNGKNSEKRWQFSRVGNYGESKALLRFIAPPEVKGVALLIVNHTDRASDQWMWLPRSRNAGSFRGSATTARARRCCGLLRRPRSRAWRC